MYRKRNKHKNIINHITTSSQNNILHSTEKENYSQSLSSALHAGATENSTKSNKCAADRMTIQN